MYINGNDSMLPKTSFIPNSMHVYKNTVFLYHKIKNRGENMDFPKLLEDIKLFFQGAFDLKDRSTGIIKKEANDEMDNFLLLCFSDLLGIPNPINYYTLEILPYVAEDLDSWEYRILGRKSVFVDKASGYDMDP